MNGTYLDPVLNKLLKNNTYEKIGYLINDLIIDDFKEILVGIMVMLGKKT